VHHHQLWGDGRAASSDDGPVAAGWVSLSSRLDALQERYAHSLPLHLGRRTNELNLARECLALAAQQTLCTVPLLVAFSAIGQHLGRPSIGRILVHYLGLSSTAGRDVTALFAGVTHASVSDTVVGLVLALLFATGVAATQQRAYEAIWYLPRANLLSVWRQVVWVIGLCAYLLLVLYVGRVGHRVGHHVHAGSTSGPFVQLLASFFFYWWTQRLLLGGRVSWRRLAPGSAVMAVGMTVLVALSGPVMSGQIVDQVDDYGLVGGTFVLSVWLLVLSGVIFGGALIGAVLVERRDPGVVPELDDLAHPALAHRRHRAERAHEN
jgi:membrane protein